MDLNCKAELFTEGSAPGSGDAGQLDWIQRHFPGICYAWELGAVLAQGGGGAGGRQGIQM